MIQKISTNDFIKHLRTTQKSSAYSSISPTAFTVAYRRTFSDIPFTKELYNELEKIRLKNNEPDFPDEYKFLQMAPLFEARHKLINKLTIDQHNFQILDIASGLTPRGLEMTADANYKYIEIDLPEIIK